MRLRQLALDTETTGIDPKSGHRIIEIAAIELIDRRLTGESFHIYINPERAIDERAQAVHGLSAEFLADKPTFAEIADAFFTFVDGAQLIIHNAPFDTGFINHEFKRFNRKLKNIDNYCSVVDTLAMARKMHPGQKNSLDALCKRYRIDNSKRILHGALVDADLLARVYLAMTGGQSSFLAAETAASTLVLPTTTHQPLSDMPELPVIYADETALAAHQTRLQAIAKAAGHCIWTAWDQGVTT